MTAHLFRENAGKMLAVLSRIFGLNNIDSVMDVVQDTFESALTKWKFSGIPENPAAWLMQVAKNKAINNFKRESKSITLSDSVSAENADYSLEMQIEHLLMPNEVEDSQLRLLLACCHPDISEKNQVIITLHILCGFGVTEIANALLMNDEAVKKALTRTKASLKQLGNILQTPLLPKYEKRIGIVQTILYLMFNEGYKTTRAKEIINNDLCYEAIRLTKLLAKNGVALANESNALLALIFCNT
jgi:RNA polymerase sigma factor (sigma-70 family)